MKPAGKDVSDEQAVQGNEDETLHCKECSSVLEPRFNDGKAAGWGCPGYKMWVLGFGLLAFAALGALLLSRPAGPGFTLSFSGYSTNAGVRMALFDLVSSNQPATLYRLMTEPKWRNLSGSGQPPGLPNQFVQYGALPPSDRRRVILLKLQVPSAAPGDYRYRLTFTYCRDRGRAAQQVHRFWDRWILRWVPWKREPFPLPGFGSRTIKSPEVAL